jgi:hypothetical protein
MKDKFNIIPKSKKLIEPVRSGLDISKLSAVQERPQKPSREELYDPNNLNNLTESKIMAGKEGLNPASLETVKSNVRMFDFTKFSDETIQSLPQSIQDLILLSGTNDLSSNLKTKKLISELPNEELKLVYREMINCMNYKIQPVNPMEVLSEDELIKFNNQDDGLSSLTQQVQLFNNKIKELGLNSEEFIKKMKAEFEKSGLSNIDIVALLKDPKVILALAAAGFIISSAVFPGPAMAASLAGDFTTTSFEIVNWLITDPSGQLISAKIGSGRLVTMAVGAIGLTVAGYWNGNNDSALKLAGKTALFPIASFVAPPGAVIAGVVYVLAQLPLYCFIDFGS